MRTLVTGGVRSGKSAHAESLLTDRERVTYVATGPEPSTEPSDDAAWSARVGAHQARRPASWTTSSEVPAAGSVILDSLGTWVAAQVDDLDGWADPTGWRVAYDRRVDTLLVALGSLDDLVVVTDEVGLGGIGTDPATRLFADLLGDLNQKVGVLVDQVHLVVAGRVLRL